MVIEAEGVDTSEVETSFTSEVEEAAMINWPTLISSASSLCAKSAPKLAVGAVSSPKISTLPVTVRPPEILRFQARSIVPL